MMNVPSQQGREEPQLSSKHTKLMTVIGTKLTRNTKTRIFKARFHNAYIRRAENTGGTSALHRNRDAVPLTRNLEIGDEFCRIVENSPRLAAELNLAKVI